MPTPLIDIDHLARLARIKLTKEELARFSQQLQTILDYFAKLQKIDTEGVAPTTHVVNLNTVMREDVPKPSLTASQILDNAPDKDGDFFKIPPVFE